jgi:Zn finger protein HypA/HybF involved in hydrogenase expression
LENQTKTIKGSCKTCERGPRVYRSTGLCGLCHGGHVRWVLSEDFDIDALDADREAMAKRAG